MQRVIVVIKAQYYWNSDLSGARVAVDNSLLQGTTALCHVQKFKLRFLRTTQPRYAWTSGAPFPGGREWRGLFPAKSAGVTRERAASRGLTALCIKMSSHFHTGYLLSRSHTPVESPIPTERDTDSERGGMHVQPSDTEFTRRGDISSMVARHLPRAPPCAGPTRR